MGILQTFSVMSLTVARSERVRGVLTHASLIQSRKITRFSLNTIIFNSFGLNKVCSNCDCMA